jgi:hypothetical protein
VGAMMVALDILWKDVLSKSSRIMDAKRISVLQPMQPTHDGTGKQITNQVNMDVV